MYISIFSDEFFQDVYSVLPVIKEWGLEKARMPMGRNHEGCIRILLTMR